MEAWSWCDILGNWSQAQYLAIPRERIVGLFVPGLKRRLLLSLRLELC